MGSNLKAILWFILSLIVSITNDALMKVLGNSMTASTISFWRFLFSTLTLLPVIFYYGVHIIQTQRISVHIVRGAILAIAISLWCYGMRFVPISTVTLTSFTIPMFTLILAGIFLKEKIGLKTVIATCIGFSGSILTLSPKNLAFPLISGVLILASILFATLDILNKILLNKNEGTISMIFYSNLFSAAFASLIPGTEFSGISLNDIALLFVLGLGANLILFCILQAFSLANASFLAPFRYLELVISMLIGFTFFRENISINMFIGGLMIVMASMIIDRRIKPQTSVEKA